MEFGDFDDDLFGKEKDDQNLKSKVGEPKWTVQRSEPGWFYEVCKEMSMEESNSFSIQHLHANHLYCTGKYSEAAQIFRELLKMLSNGNHQREVSEGLARSLLKIGETEMSLEAATQFELSCKSQAHFASFHSLCSEIYRKRLDPSRELFHLQKIIKTHPVNPNFWLRTAECYGLVVEIDVYSVPYRLSRFKDATWYAAACLIRVDIILKSLIGKELIGALRKMRNQKLIDAIHPAINSLPPAFVSIAHDHLCRDVYRPDLFQNQEEDGFVDLGSSKRAKSMECADEDSCSVLGNDNQQDWFEKQWFSFCDSIQDINLYYISPGNTQGC